MDRLELLKKRLSEYNPYQKIGAVSKIVGLTIESKGPDAFLGELCKIITEYKKSYAEVVGFNENGVILMPLEDISGLKKGCQVIKTNQYVSIPVSEELLGRVVDALGRPLDGKKILSKEKIPIVREAPNPLIRKRITTPISVGIRAIDGFLTLGYGQRIGIFAGSGVGKSTLLGMIARNTSADINVISLIGERGREVREFIEKDLKKEGLKRSIVVVSTSDQPALLRVKALLTATSIAEYFRDKGYNVLLMVDSLTRWAMAQREVGLATGEPPTTRGYPPSVFAGLPKILERAGNSDKGSITGIYTVLVEADDFNEPISDTVRGIVDGHIILSRKLAESAHYPAIDVLMSVSRLMNDIVTKEHKISAMKLKDLIATYYDAKDLIDVGAYKKGTNPKIDKSIELIDEINKFLKQSIDESMSFDDTVQYLISIAKKI
ncbi:ATP synthase [Thermosipho melanesiensis]|uniref:Flagellar protein export ATPase FliI n=2 Tax=Thermosipho melanesiensis TaxID=46541 RepID=A6LMG7_THEM4|nr:flagellar protein export ATPase FliI [Thermosipho melanesiensis]ABR31118.1 flagellar protein export ATPase FliI [Thermosipho melanesiensis BI429]APT74209.1 ATP synthase [Thermosipho melanesiensis]OOC36156.1 ATP synthase [Thermosipho melanesiensis]OOC36972.1 ATP synthase [Thermosipho melanesiensis]OOC37724.1 ATP synthase [Thermosipho melanesiensis]